MIYARKSTTESEERQVRSLGDQVVECTELAQKMGLKVIKVIKEAESAKEPDIRPKFREMVEEIKKGKYEGIIAWHPDRLARNMKDAGEIIDLLDKQIIKDLHFVSFTFQNNTAGKMLLGIAFVLSKQYSDQLSDNVKRGLKHKVRMGIWPMKAPYGYINDSKTKSIQIDLEKAEVVKRAFELFASGGKSFKEISLYLSRYGITRGWRTTNNNPLHINQIKKMLTNRFYIGILYYNGEYYKASHKLFISKKLFDEVQQQIRRIERPRLKGHNFAFVGLARCGECGCAVTGEQHIKKYRNGTSQTFIYYRCTKKLKPCVQKYISEPELEIQVRKILTDCVLPQDWANDWYKWMEEDEKKELILSEENIKRLKDQVKTLDKKLNILLDSYLDQVIDAEIYKNKKNEFFEEKLKIEEEITKIKTDGSSWLELLFT